MQSRMFLLCIQQWFLNMMVQQHLSSVLCSRVTLPKIRKSASAELGCPLMQTVLPSTPIIGSVLRRMTQHSSIVQMLTLKIIFMREILQAVTSLTHVQTVSGIGLLLHLNLQIQCQSVSGLELSVPHGSSITVHKITPVQIQVQSML